MNSIDQTSIQTAITTITDTSTADYRKKLNAIKTILESNTPLAEDQKNTLKSALTQKASTTTQTDPQSNSFFKDLASCFRSVINGQSFISARKQIEPLSAQLRALLSDKCPRKNLPPSKTVSKEQILEFIKLCKFDKSGKRSSNKQDSKINTLIMTLWNKINAKFEKDNDEIDQLINFKEKIDTVTSKAPKDNPPLKLTQQELNHFYKEISLNVFDHFPSHAAYDLLKTLSAEEQLSDTQNFHDLTEFKYLTQHEDPTKITVPTVIHTPTQVDQTVTDGKKELDLTKPFTKKNCCELYFTPLTALYTAKYLLEQGRLDDLTTLSKNASFRSYAFQDNSPYIGDNANNYSPQPFSNTKTGKQLTTLRSVRSFLSIPNQSVKSNEQAEVTPSALAAENHKASPPIPNSKVVKSVRFEGMDNKALPTTQTTSQVPTEKAAPLEQTTETSPITQKEFISICKDLDAIKAKDLTLITIEAKRLIRYSHSYTSYLVREIENDLARAKWSPRSSYFSKKAFNNLAFLIKQDSASFQGLNQADLTSIKDTLNKFPNPDLERSDQINKLGHIIKTLQPGSQ